MAQHFVTAHKRGIAGVDLLVPGGFRHVDGDMTKLLDFDPERHRSHKLWVPDGYEASPARKKKRMGPSAAAFQEAGDGEQGGMDHE
ncbi:hypothetical protein HDU89_000243 [Geranomyces variabilis]|nr:hypothetical protein HDU89_000243 [Geranomyces variabilis]